MYLTRILKEVLLKFPLHQKSVFQISISSCQTQILLFWSSGLRKRCILVFVVLWNVTNQTGALLGVTCFSESKLFWVAHYGKLLHSVKQTWIQWLNSQTKANTLTLQITLVIFLTKEIRGHKGYLFWVFFLFVFF